MLCFVAVLLAARGVHWERAARVGSAGTFLPTVYSSTPNRSCPGPPVCRLADVGLPNTFLLHPLSQHHIREGAPALEVLLERLGKLPQPLGGSKPSHLCLAFACTCKPGPRCSSNSCKAHCSDPLCPRHERSNTYVTWAKLWRQYTRPLA